MKTIATTVTVVLREGGRKVSRPPGYPVTLPSEEADRILARFGGAEAEPVTEHAVPDLDAIRAKIGQLGGRIDRRWGERRLLAELARLTRA